MGEVLTPVACIVLGVLLGAAAWHKLAGRAVFRATLAEYEILPAALVGPVAALLPFLEAGLAGLWITGTMLPLAAAGTSALLLAYAGAVAVNLRRGRVHISCGCGIGAEQPLSIGIVARNVLLALLAGAGFVPVGALNWLDHVVVALASLAALLALGASSELMRNGMHMAAWTASRRDG